MPQERGAPQNAQSQENKVVWKADNAGHPQDENPYIGTVTCHYVLMDNENGCTHFHLPTFFKVPVAPPSHDPDLTSSLAIIHS